MKEKKPGGKKHGQKYKSFLVWKILLEKTDDFNGLNSSDIRGELEDYGIAAEEQSIRRDITMLQELFGNLQDVDDEGDCEVEIPLEKMAVVHSIDNISSQLTQQTICDMLDLMGSDLCELWEIKLADLGFNVYTPTQSPAITA